MNHFEIKRNGMQKNIPESYQRTWVEIDLDAILYNIRCMKKRIHQNTNMLAVIKTDGYGHGAVPIARCLESEGYLYGFGTATAEEAHILRKAGIKKPILVIGYTFPYSYEMLVKEEIRPAVFRMDMVKQLAETAAEIGKPIKIHVKVDTGMSRIGITPDQEGIRFLQELMKYPLIEIEGIFTHFARADEEDKTESYRQLNVFREFVDKAETELKIGIPIKHCANSAGILELAESQLDLVRAGITMYGLAPSADVKSDIFGLRPALSWQSTVVQVKTVHAGQSISYGGTHTVKEDTVVATIPVGYGDGYPRSLSSKGYVLIKGNPAPILGRVCMDQFMVDVTSIPDVAENEIVTLIGTDGEAEITAELLGELSGRFNYELVCDIGKRVPRVYLQNGIVTAVKDYHNDYQ